MDLMFQPLRKYADFTGRARRMELWLFWLLLIGIQIVFSILIGLVAGPTAAVADPTDPFAVLNGRAPIPHPGSAYTVSCARCSGGPPVIPTAIYCRPATL